MTHRPQPDGWDPDAAIQGDRVLHVRRRPV
ncbi:hypothetical protein ACVW07_002954 [Cellulomonas sp. URHB0016]